MANNEKILVIDDSAEMLKVMEMLLSENGFKPITAKNGESGLKKLNEHQPKLVILDLSMPGIDGWQVCELIREQSNVPIIILTAAHVSESDIIRGLGMGANDYVTKPFKQGEFLARIRSNLRWAPPPKNGAVFADEYLSINLADRQVLREGKMLKLTKKEFELLSALVIESPRIVTHESLFERVWGSSYPFDVNYVRIFVGHLRKKIERDLANPVYIHNERGIGYRFEKQTREHNE
jgi:two-component system KDP operon response regulator KdpE